MNTKKCKHCGGNFHPCFACENSKTYYGYKKDFCSPVCFQKYMTDKSDNMKKYPMINPIRGKVFDGDQMIDVRDFEFNSLKDHWFLDHYNIKRNINDFHHIILYREALVDIITSVYENAITEGYEKAKQEIKKNKRTIEK